MPRESNLEFKVGIFMLIALAALTMFIFSVSDSSVMEKGKTIRVIFGFANGLKKKAPVRIAGVDQGIVQDIKLFFDRADSKTKVEVDLRIRQDTMIPGDSVITVNQLGMMGEKYIEISPGEDNLNFFQDDQIVLGKDPIAQEAISARVMEVSNKLENAIGGIDRLITDKNNVDSIGTTLKNLSSLTGSLDGMVFDMKEGKGTIGKLLYDERLYDDLQGLTADLKEHPWKLLYRPKRKEIDKEDGG
ncbi:MAG: MCE family protein [Candidatus Omnitrophica bacterium]|nr:MCE family protein [Candidatus Omnitrophota bacterium]